MKWIFSLVIFLLLLSSVLYAGDLGFKTAGDDTSWENNVKKGNHALWFQGGLGAAFTNIYDRIQSSEFFFHGELSAHFRRDQKAISLGVHGEGKETLGVMTFWGTYGYNYSGSWFESTLSVGIGLSQWYYDTESIRGKIYSHHVPALVIRAQTIVHLRQGFGLGLVLTGNVNRELSYMGGGLVFALGLWNW